MVTIPSKLPAGTGMDRAMTVKLVFLGLLGIRKDEFLQKKRLGNLWEPKKNGFETWFLPLKTLITAILQLSMYNTIDENAENMNTTTLRQSNVAGWKILHL